MRSFVLTMAAAITLAGGVAAQETAGPIIQTGDVDRFYALYDMQDGLPTAEQLQTYIDEGSEGLRHLARARNVTGERIAGAISARPEIYENARACAETLPRVRVRVAEAMQRFAELYPEAEFPPATFVIGRGRPVAIGSRAGGIQVGLEALCATEFLNPDVEDRFVRVLVHEFAHTQQAFSTEGGQPTVLEVSLVEGIAEFVTELTSGAPAYSYLAPLVAGREAEIETAFLADIDSTDLTPWVFNSTPEKPGDLGYWAGYRIARAHYRNAADSRQALRDLLGFTDAKALLAASGWRPGQD